VDFSIPSQPLNLRVERFDEGRRLVAREHVQWCSGRVGDSQAHLCRVPEQYRRLGVLGVGLSPLP